MQPYYQDTLCTIYHGDCREILPSLGKVDLVLTDPPYGVTDNSWDVPVPPVLWMRSPGAVVTATEPFANKLINSAPLRFRFDMVWVKNCCSNAFNVRSMPMRRHERVLVFGEYSWNPIMRKRSAIEMSRLNAAQRKSMQYASPDTVLQFQSVNARSSERTEHQSQKPVALMSYLARSFAAASSTILDPFMGSGTTLRAAKDLGIKCIGIEREEKYCAIAVERLRQEVLF